GTTEFRLYAVHLKASMGFESNRLTECAGLRDSMNAMPAGTTAMAIGDFNFYKASLEPGYSKLQEPQVNNVGRVFDVLASGDWHDSPAFTNIHTQCPCGDSVSTSRGCA